MKFVVKTVVVLIILIFSVFACRDIISEMTKLQGDSTIDSHTTHLITHNNISIPVNYYEKYVATYGITPPHSFQNVSNVVGHEPILQEIKAISKLWDCKQHSTLYQPPTGILLYGPPGTGKTTLSKGICTHINANVSFLHVSSDLIENKYQGEGLKFMRAVFTLCTKIEPCVVFFDEIDGLMSKRSDMDQSHVNNMKTMFLSGLDQLRDSKTNVLVICATNRPECLDPALMRRLELHFHMDVPTVEQKCNALSNMIGGHSDDYTDFVLNVLPINATLHDLYTFIRYCIRTQLLKADIILDVTEMDWGDIALTSYYNEYKTLFKFINH